MTELAGVPDPRTVFVSTPGPGVLGSTCLDHGHRTAFRVARCPRCAGPIQPATFRTDGTVVSSTRVEIGVGGIDPPYVLAYVDLIDGPRLLVHVRSADLSVPKVGRKVRVVGTTPTGDLLAEEVA